MKQIAIILLAAVALLSGCTTSSQRSKYVVSINGLAAQTTNSATSYFILSGDKGIDATDLQFQEYSGFVERALILRGFQHAKSIQEADMAVFLSYGIGAPKEHIYSYNIPHFGQTGISSSTTYGSISGNSYSGTTYYNPTYGVTGYSSHVGTYATYTRHIVIEAIDMSTYKEQNKAIPFWKTIVVSEGTSDDLRRVFPVMLGAASQYLGTNTREIRTIELSENDPRVLSVKGIEVEKK